jgi:predicted nuclease with TOPRIM domain
MKKMADQQYSGQDIYADIAVKLRDLEEKQSIIKDRVLLIGENLVSEKEDMEKELMELKTKLASLEEELRRLRLSLQIIVENSDNFIRKNEFQILQRQFEMFQPLNLARLSDVEAMINRALGNK